MRKSPGSVLEGLLSNASREVIIVSPFIKRSAFDRLLVSVPEAIELTCVTRWRLQEIASGISDIEIWESLGARGNASLWLRSDLHAKYYRADDACILGSANVTDTGLGWRLHPNLELLVSPADSTSLRSDFETLLMANAIRVDEMLYQHVSKAVARLVGVDKQYWPQPVEDFIDSAVEEMDIDDSRWLPETRHPENLYFAYTKDVQQLTIAAQSTARRDLQHFSIPPGLPREAFDGEVGLQLLEKPLIRQLDVHLSQPRRFGEMTAVLSKHLSSLREANEAWQTTMRWMRYYLPARYALAIPSHTEIMYRVM